MERVRGALNDEWVLAAAIAETHDLPAVPHIEVSSARGTRADNQIVVENIDLFVGKADEPFGAVPRHVAQIAAAESSGGAQQGAELGWIVSRDGGEVWGFARSGSRAPWRSGPWHSLHAICAR